MKLLIYDDKKNESVYVLNKPEVRLGRNVNNDIHLENISISRNHAVFTIKDDGVYIADNNSKNGVIINKKRILEAKLYNNDKINIGNYVVIFKDESSMVLTNENKAQTTEEAKPYNIEKTQVEVSEAHKINDNKPILIKSVKDVDADSKRSVYDLSSFKKLTGADQALLEKKSKMLISIMNMSEALIASTSLPDLLETVMELVFKTVIAQRGFIMLIDKETGELDTKIVKYSDDSLEKTQKITISKTIADTVIKQKAGILTSDAAMDTRFKSGESIRIIGIRSCMCVPLWDKDKIIGILYVDSLMSKSQFTGDDLDLLASLANHAAIGIEQARLNEQIIKEQKIRQKLERYHSPEVVNIIISKKEEDLNVKNTKATILFADIKDFTPFCERYEPHTVRVLLNEYFEIMTDILFEFRGTLDKYLGDGLLALFGAPISEENDSERAILAALKMSKALSEINEKRKPEMRFQIRTGINTGNVLAGDIGSVRRMDYTVLGDPVNTTQRISEAADPDQILISESTYQETKHLFNLRKLEQIKVKGKKHFITVYEVLKE
ncbi:GAF domain-containing protein [bacterium]|nr:GAF domain-containing protein [bacterium]